MSLRWYQQEASDAVFDYFRNFEGNPVVAMPTGTGKSHVIGDIAERALRYYPETRLVMMTHDKRLIQQNYNKLIEAWPTAPAGIFSAGLKRRDTLNSIIYGGIASMNGNIEKFGFRHLGIIDECQLVNVQTEGMYKKVIDSFLKINPKFKVIGLSATPFRMGQGMVTDGGLFTDVCYDLTSYEQFNRLIDEGWIKPLIPRPTITKLDVSKVGTVSGDFNKGQLAEAVDKSEVTYAAINEAMEYGADRNCWLVFASSIEHAEHVSETLNSFGISSCAVHSQLGEEECDKRIADYKAGKYRAIVNYGMLTTGFDHPPIDLIVMLRPTKSVVLWVQMLGRGTRPCDETGKENCMVLDFAGNTLRLGPINDPQIPKRKGPGTGDVPVKICKDSNTVRSMGCGAYNHTRNRFCIQCAEEFRFEVRIDEVASTQALIKTDIPQHEWFEVTRVIYTKHIGGASGMPTMLATYYCGRFTFRKFLPFSHQGPASKLARDWWRSNRFSDISTDAPHSTQEAINRTSELAQPRSIKVWTNKRNPEIVEYVF